MKKYDCSMRMYIFYDKDIVKSIAPKITNISFDIDFFEYSEKRGYTTNNNLCFRPEIESCCKEEKKDKKGRMGISEENGTLCNVEIIKRYINIEDISSIKNNNFYYSIMEKITEDDRVKKVIGKISNLDKTSFLIGKDKFIIGEEAYNKLIEVYKHECEVNCLGYKINCLNSEYDVFKTIVIYIE